MNKIFFNDKPLCLSKLDENRLLVSTADGKIYAIEPPYTNKKLIFSGLSPISCVEYENGKIFFGDWNGNVCKMSVDVREYSTDKKYHENMGISSSTGMRVDASLPTNMELEESTGKETAFQHQGDETETDYREIKQMKSICLGNAIIKCMKIFNGGIYVSIDRNLIIMDFDLQIRTKMNMNNKILCLAIMNDQLYMGMSVPSIQRFDNGTINEIATHHQSSILCISTDENGDVMTSSADKTLMVKNRTLYTGTEWIRVCLGSYFTDGNLVKKRTGSTITTLFVHGGYVVGLQESKDRLFSIGLDCCLAVVEKDESKKMDVACDWDEEEEIRRLNEEFG